MRDFETYTETRPVVAPISRLDVNQDEERRRELKKDVADVVEWYVRHDPESAAAVGGLTRIVKRVSEDVEWPTTDVHNAISSSALFDANLAEHTVAIVEPSPEVTSPTASADEDDDDEVPHGGRRVAQVRYIAGRGPFPWRRPEPGDED
jgi:hypothetical protein